MVPTPSSSSLSKKLLLYSLGAGAATAASSAQATITSTTNIEASGNAFYVDLANNAYSTTNQATDQFGFTSNTSQLAAYGGKVNSTFLGEIGAQNVTNTAGTSVSYILKLCALTTIGSGTSFTGSNTPSTFDAQASPTAPTNAVGQPSAGTDSGFWHPGDSGYVALAFGGPNNFEYGWASLTLNNLTGTGAGVFTLHGCGYQNDGTAIAAGQVPEPSTVALLVAGAAGVGLMRSRQRRRAVVPAA